MANLDVARRERSGLGAQRLGLLAFGMAIATLVAAQAPATLSGLESGERQLEDGRSTLDEATLVAARKMLDECVRQSGKDSRCYYDLARTDYYLERVKELQKDNKAAERELDSAVENARRAIDLDDRSSDAHALLADLYGMKIGLGGMFTGMKYGPKANAESERAFQLDANNPRAHAVAGRKYLFGGDLGKAIESFQKATTLNQHFDEAFVWLAIAYRKQGDAQRAQAALSEALRLNSRSAFARRTQSESDQVK